MLAGIVILLNQKVYCVNVYARISLNRSFSDTVFQLMWDTKKSENILMYMYVRCPSTPPWTRLRYQYVLRSDAEGRLHVLRPFVSKLKQNAITMNSNNESKIFRLRRVLKTLLMLLLCLCSNVPPTA